MGIDRERFHVLVAGAGIGGLTLARSLELAGISYTLLEGRGEVAPQVGASIGIMPNGGRILGQLGCLDDILAVTSPLTVMHNRKIDGTMLSPPRDNPELVAARLGLSIMFLDRQLVLRTLYDSLQDKSRIHLNKRVAHVDTSEEGVTLKCTDGSAYNGHVLVGCDGVNSAVRHEMWRLADEQSPGFIPESDKKAMRAEYKCMFGISSDTPGMVEEGTMNVGYAKHHSNLIIVNRGPRIYWFMTEKLDRVYETNEIPRYSEEDAQRFADKIAHWKLTETTTFKMLFDRVETHSLVALEEASYKKWTYGRIACCGDSIHKVTHNAGAGGNACIESAAAMANELKKLADGNQALPSRKAIQAALLNYQNTRQPRSNAICATANALTRIQAMKTPVHRFLVHWIFPNAGDTFTDLNCDGMSGAVRLDYLPVPKQTLRGNLPFNPNSGAGKKESKLKRLLLAVPLLALHIAAKRFITLASVRPLLGTMVRESLFRNGDFSFPVAQRFTGWTAFDNTWRPLTIAFMPSTFGLDPVSRTQLISFLADFGLLYSILLIESARRANNLTIFNLVLVAGVLSQLMGAGKILPAFFFLVYPSSQIDYFKTLDMRLTNMAYSSTVLISMSLGYYVPGAGQFFASTLKARHFWNWTWQIFPITVSLTQRLLARIVPNTVESDRIKSPLRDLPIIALQVGLGTLASAAIWVHTWLCSAYSMRELFTPPFAIPSSTSFMTAMRELLQWDWVFLFAGCYVWLFYSFWDLKAAGMAQESWASLLVAAIGSTLAFGPGATFAIAWCYREYCLAYRRHKDAVVDDGILRGEKKANGSAK
ncbi:FAD/NAD(P)-binding domain-containing protein [Myriangium duriaei CBS 260.36]|uniref:FAD/NAD(P)-binding domain-containing protein n=1 Tax=Myriangium duriaei CBS 260.36 TaxID=1168546 RepID=A0A9P4MLB4_9PEZI|nr:FAD/NAD(P)-binding domain-containing protein [Myriangium duriaei CBS 260.36]